MIYSGLSGLSDLADTVATCISDLTPHVNEWDSIVVTGCSGMLVGPAVAIALGKPIGVIRKEYDREHSHSYGLLVGWEHFGERYLFLDDFSSGTPGCTLERVIKTIDENFISPRSSKPEITATYYYSSRRYTNGFPSVPKVEVKMPHPGFDTLCKVVTQATNVLNVWDGLDLIKKYQIGEYNNTPFLGRARDSRGRFIKEQ